MGGSKKWNNSMNLSESEDFLVKKKKTNTGGEVPGDTYKPTHVYGIIKSIRNCMYRLICLHGNMALDQKMVYNGNL